MGFRDLEIKPAYDSNEDDVLHDFYIPVLSEAVRYRRLSGMFSSSALAVAARGIAGFLSNDGEMDLVIGAILSKADVDAIAAGMTEPEKVIAKTVIKDLENIEDEFVRDHVKALAWMVANRKLNIKVAIPLDVKGRPLPGEAVERSGIFHQKVGVLIDANEDLVSFSGSINESAYAWTRNIEEFKVFRSWVPGEKDHLESDLRKIKKYWEERPENVIVTDVPTAIREKLITMAPENTEALHLERYTRKTIKLRDYQRHCADLWFQTGRGLIEMATGTGKTYAAIACLELILQKEQKLTVIISVPFVHLVTQWIKELGDWGLGGIEVHGSTNTWVDNLMNHVLDLNNDYSKLLIVVTTHDTFSNPKFTEIMTQAKVRLLLIADEVHGVGSEQRRLGLSDKYHYRIGLSATPRRWLDDEGTLALDDYFGKTVFVYSLADAIRDEYLVPYDYFPKVVEMTIEEMEKYREYSRKLAQQFYAAKADSVRRESLELLAIQRQRIVINAQNKMVAFVQILEGLDHLKHTLVYCSPMQIEQVQNTLNNRGIIQHKFTAKENKQERAAILREFAKGTYQVLVAMNCLDEGVDVPPARLAVFLSSSGNPKQFIQRRGRILRRFPGKDKATVYDVIVVPSLNGEIDPELFEAERRILQRELKRVYEFARSSKNVAETVNTIYPVLERYGLSMRELGEH